MPEEMIPSIPINDTTLLKVTEGTSSRTYEIHDAISRRAFEIFEANGRVSGRDVEDWVQAESELLYPVSLDISESDDALVVRGALPGFKAADIELTVEPGRLTIAGNREIQEGQVTEKLVAPERRGAWVLLTVDLPVQVDTERVTGSLKDGTLELTLPRAEARTTIKFQLAAA